jgi:phosphonopyruvate decarboxylase
MIRAEEFMAEASRRGFDFYAGVPCSFLTPLINAVISNPALRYVGAASEGEAVAIAAGAWLAGRRTVVICQNSGLGNAVNPLTSLNAPFRIPTLLITTWRGEPGLHDEPQHEVMGQITQDLLRVIRVPQGAFPATSAAIAPAFNEATETMEVEQSPFAWVMRKGDVEDTALDQSAPAARPPGRRLDLPAEGPRPTRAAALQQFLDLADEDAAVIATTGKCGRELFTLADRAQHLYQVGSMGGASGMGLGVALNTARPVVVLDGDGAALMKLGAFATIGAYAPANLLHIVLDNGVHDSTGGQATVSASVDFAGVALACGYSLAASCASLHGFAAAFKAARTAGGPALIHLRIAPGSMATLGRPTETPPLLLTPGPLTTQPHVREAMLRDWGSRDAPFIALTTELRSRLLDVAKADPNAFTAIPLQGSGTFIVEAALSTLVDSQARLLVLVNGAYGERMVQIAKRLGRAVEILRWPEREPVDAQGLARTLAAAPGVTHVALVHCETTTGLLNPLAEVAAVAAEAGAALIVDAMSSFGALDIDLRSLPAAAILASSNKCLEGAPGIGFAIAARGAMEGSAGVSPSLSLDLHDQWRALETNGQWRFTPPVQVVAALVEALRLLAAEGGPTARLARYQANFQTLADGMAALGYELYLDRAHQAPIIATFRPPADRPFEFERFAAALAADGFVIYPGKLTQAETFRIGCIGAVEPGDMARLLIAVERATT